MWRILLAALGPEERKAWSEWGRGQGIAIVTLMVVLFVAVPWHLALIHKQCDDRLNQILEHDAKQQDYDRELYKQSIQTLCRSFGSIEVPIAGSGDNTRP